MVTDGAFPTHGTMTAYILRWAEIYVRSKLFLAVVPLWIYSFLGWVSRLRSQRRLNCRFPDIETAVAPPLAAPVADDPRRARCLHRAGDRPLLFALAREPKEIWLVPDAKHNRCRECEPEAYAARVIEFLGRYAPRRPVEEPVVRASRPAVSAYASEPRLAMTASKLIPPVTVSVTS